MTNNKFKYVWSHIGKTLKDFGALITPYVKTVDSNSNLIVADSSSEHVVVEDQGTHHINHFSGLLLVNDHFDGRVELWLAGGGDTVPVAATNTGGDPIGSTLTISDDNLGYVWTNVDNLGADGRGITFTVIKTRSEA